MIVVWIYRVLFGEIMLDKFLSIRSPVLAMPLYVSLGLRASKSIVVCLCLLFVHLFI